MHDDLKDRLRDELDAGLGTRPSSDLGDVLQRGRRKRTGLVLVTAVSALLIGGVVLAGGVWVGQNISSPSNDKQDSIQPAENHGDSTDPTPNEDSGDTEGTGRIGLLDGQVAFHTAGRWKEHQQWRFISASPMGPETLLGHEQGPAAALLVITDPAPLERSCPRTTSSSVSVEMFVEAIRTHPGLSSTEPVIEQISDVDAVRLDLTPVEGASLTCSPGESAARSPLSVITPPSTNFGVPVVTGSRETAFGPSLAYLLEADQKMRLYLLDLPAGSADSLAIAIVAAEEEFDAAVEAAKPVLDSFEFATS